MADIRVVIYPDEVVSYSEILTVEQYIKRIEEEARKLKRERDAAVYDLAINRSCAVCMHERGFKCAAHGCAHENEWQWRGVCEENSNAENRT